jgi:hypothetical protein
MTEVAQHRGGDEGDVAEQPQRGSAVRAGRGGVQVAEEIRDEARRPGVVARLAEGVDQRGGPDQVGHRWGGPGGRLGQVDVHQRLPDPVDAGLRGQRGAVGGRHRMARQVGRRTLQRRGDVRQHEPVVRRLPPPFDPAPGGVRDAGPAGGVPDAPAPQQPACLEPLADRRVGTRPWSHRAPSGGIAVLLTDRPYPGPRTRWCNPVPPRAGGGGRVNAVSRARRAAGCVRDGRRGSGRIPVVTGAPAEPPETSVSGEHFDNLYLAKDDPWDLATKWHDQRKYAVTVASLPRPRYRRGYEPGCSIGLLTRMLAPRCDELLAVDSVESAVRQAAEVVRDLPHVEVRRAVLPAELPDARYDLIVVGDLLYYLSAGDLELTLDGLAGRLEPGGDLVAVHFRDRQGGTYDGFHVHAALAARPDLERLVRHEDEWFVLDVLRRSG